LDVIIVKCFWIANYGSSKYFVEALKQK
jgi:hypothetical protein